MSANPITCSVCGRSWFAHLPECSRHQYRPEGMEPGRYVLTFGPHAGTPIEEVGINADGCDYLAATLYRNDIPELDREIIGVFLSESAHS